MMKPCVRINKYKSGAGLGGQVRGRGQQLVHFLLESCGLFIQEHLRHRDTSSGDKVLIMTSPPVGAVTTT